MIVFLIIPFRFQVSKENSGKIDDKEELVEILQRLKLLTSNIQLHFYNLSPNLYTSYLFQMFLKLKVC